MLHGWGIQQQTCAKNKISAVFTVFVLDKDDHLLETITGGMFDGTRIVPGS
ncbi:MAG TPA: hypothetical protein VKI20_00155 [Acidimicrobiales bacterium]|nr:hypothetical protein [Acidimicrobiales bacterium]